jgi:hypothetical protein
LIGAIFTNGVIYALLPALLGLAWIALALLLSRLVPRTAGSRSPEAFGALAGPGLYCLLAATQADQSTVLIVVGTAFVAIALVAYAVAGWVHPAKNH